MVMIDPERVVGRGFLYCLAAVALLLAPAAPAAAETDDPLALGKSLPGHDAAQSRRALAEHFAGVWRVVHTEDNGRPRSGRAEVATNGSDISLVLTGPDGPDHYDLVEVDAVRFAPDTGPFVGSLSARFRRSSDPVSDGDGKPIAAARPFPVPTDQTLLSFKKDEFDLDLPIVWSRSESRYIRVNLAADANEDKYQGVWSEELGDRLAGGGLATWIRGVPRIDGVLVVDDQLDPAAGSSYPYRPDGTGIDQVSRERTLVVYGGNLPDMADRADIESGSRSVSYAPDFRAGDDRQRLISATFERFGVADPDRFDALIVTAKLDVGITPGAKTISVNGATGQWPLIFADQAAALRFARSGNVPTQVYYEGDSGFVELSFQTDMPFADIGIRLLKGDKDPVEIAVLLASRQDDDDPLFTTYRSDSFQLYSRENETLSPPEDDDALRVPVLEGMVLQAALLDRAEALTVPPVARAEIFSNPSQLGGLWKEALDRVAKCNGEIIDDYETYQREEAAKVSKLIVTELGRRNIPLLKGDHAAALLIRDEFVKLTLELLPGFKKQADDIDQARAARDSARRRPQIATMPFWRESKVVFVKEGFLWDSETEYSLADTLDTAKIAEQQGVTPDEARAWAEKQTMAAAKAQVEKMEFAASRALDAGDCDIGELLLVAGHRSDPVTTRIMPRLVRLETEQGPPPRQYWVADMAAQGFVKSLYIAGAAVRALEQYSEADTNVAAAVAAIATAGLSIGLEAGGYAAAGLWVSLTDAAIGIGEGLVGVDKYYSGEADYEFAQGAASALGGDILDDALAGRQSAVMTALGVLLPTASGASSLGHLRHFKSIQRGQKLFKASDGILDDLAKLSEADRTNLASYYTDMLRQVRKSDLDKLDDADRAAFSAFQDFFKARNVTPPSTTGPVAGPSPRPPDPNETVRIDPTSTDPNEMATQINPNPRSKLPPREAAATPRQPRPEDAVDIYENDPGVRVADRPDGYLQGLIEKSARGEELTAEEILDKLDYMRLERQRALEAANAAAQSGASEPTP